MISIFIKEQKRYTQRELTSLFESDSDEIIYIIKKLKEYGILKAVAASKTQRNMSDLIEEDVEIEETELDENDYYYVFTFVGVITAFGRVLKCYPKYIHNDNQPIKELAQVLQVIEKFNSKEQIIKIFNDSDESKSFNLLAVMLYLLHDYYENSSYENDLDIIETNGDGEILWDKTINETFTFISNNRPYYMEMYTQKNINDEFDYFKRLHESIISICSREIQAAGLDELFGILTVDISDEELDDFGDIEDILNNIQFELNRQFVTRKQLLLKTMYAYISQSSHLNDFTSFAMYGTNSFNLVWEKVCAEVFENKLDTPIRDLPVVIKDFKHSSRLIDLVEKPHWHGKNDSFSRDAKDTLIPDIVSLNKVKDSYQFIIFDAKYYNLTLEENRLAGHPGIGDVTKQYLYQLAYKQFIQEGGFISVKNCFLMPTEASEVIDKGFVNLNMLDNLELESIQIRQLPATEVYSDYLRNKRFDISRLNL
ncbi:LlaJI family restriction endonuclease [Listeria monocytogenes]|nr:LlaJI family restriction endonuclease [Listeria monocytogenes]EAC5624332.1 LlaJI family restriction endonuclease [Listeria monocytogenes]EAC8864759.1 LlaJI family restriction endonuclease [Listeria monocytogenes]EAD0177028.1 LlaJI family restriction endonuclease [Listeria monocytogenes]EAD0177266.1 LlaJI family restriction endonuclease [Listeria monocytogenes]